MGINFEFLWCKAVHSEDHAVFIASHAINFPVCLRGVGVVQNNDGKKRRGGERWKKRGEVKEERENSCHTSPTHTEKYSPQHNTDNMFNGTLFSFLQSGSSRWSEWCSACEGDICSTTPTWLQQDYTASRSTQRHTSRFQADSMSCGRFDIRLAL